VGKKVDVGRGGGAGVGGDKGKAHLLRWGTKTSQLKCFIKKKRGEEFLVAAPRMQQGAWN